MARSGWIDTVRRGLAADRPVTADPPPDGYVMYYSYDTGDLSLWRYGGDAWESVLTMPGGLELAANAGVAGTGVAITSVATSQMRKMRLTLTNLVIDVPTADGFGGTSLITLPDRNLVVIGCETDLSVVKGNTATGIVATTDLDMAIGTAVASNTTLATTMLNILPKQDIDTNAVTVDLNAHSLAATPVLTGILDSATNELFLNAVAVGGITVDDTLTVSGTIDLFFFDLGNVTS